MKIVFFTGAGVSKETAVNSIETVSSMLKQIELEPINNYRK